MFDIFKGQRGLTLFATILLIFYGIYYMPIDSFGMNAPIKMALMASSIVVLLFYTFKTSKALILGIMYLIFQYTVASFHPDTFRWSTYIYSIEYYEYCSKERKSSLSFEYIKHGKSCYLSSFSEHKSEFAIEKPNQWICEQYTNGKIHDSPWSFKNRVVQNLLVECH